VDSVHLHPTLAALERRGADDHAIGQLVNNRLVLNYDRIDGAVAEVLIGAPQATGANEISPVEDPLWTSSKVIMRRRFSLLYDRPLSLRDLGL
jgi:hypothetical protein